MGRQNKTELDRTGWCAGSNRYWYERKRAGWFPPPALIARQETTSVRKTRRERVGSGDETGADRGSVADSLSWPPPPRGRPQLTQPCAQQAPRSPTRTPQSPDRPNSADRRPRRLRLRGRSRPARARRRAAGRGAAPGRALAPRDRREPRPQDRAAADRGTGAGASDRGRRPTRSIRCGSVQPNPSTCPRPPPPLQAQKQPKTARPSTPGAGSAPPPPATPSRRGSSRASAPARGVARLAGRASGPLQSLRKAGGDMPPRSRGKRRGEL